MEANEALGVAAQVAVTLAGFAGIVVVFRPSSIQHWTALDRARLHLLLHNSICPLAYALFGMLLLGVKPPPESIWRCCSLFGLLFQLPGAVIAAGHSKAIGKDAYKDSGGRLLFYAIAIVGAGSLVLQVFNVAWLNLFWPFYFSIFMHLMAGMLQFTRMVLLVPPQE